MYSKYKTKKDNVFVKLKYIFSNFIYFKTMLKHVIANLYNNSKLLCHNLNYEGLWLRLIEYGEKSFFSHSIDGK